MNLPDHLLDDSWYLLGWLVLGVLLAGVWRSGSWRGLADQSRFNQWLANCVLLTLVWSMKAGVLPGLNLHLLGAMVFTLQFGAPLALLGSCLTLAGITLNGATGWQGFGLNALLMGAVPVGISALLVFMGQRILPKNIFVFIFAHGFFGSAAVVVGTGAVASVLFWLSGAYPLATLLDDYLPYFILLGFSEAWIAGMLVTLMVVYRPQWLVSFDDRQYLEQY